MGEFVARRRARILFAVSGTAIALSACGSGQAPKPKIGVYPKKEPVEIANPLIPQLVSCERTAYRARIHKRKLSFDAYVKSVSRIARGCGVSNTTLRAHLRRLRRDRRVLRFYSARPAFEIVQFAMRDGTLIARRRARPLHPMQTFMERDVAYFVRQGTEKYREHKALVDAVASKYGVSAAYLMAIWGIETAYGKSPGDFNVVRSLATLGHGHRVDRIRLFFTKELIAALILVDKEVAPKDWRGSYAGASGNPQFMPSDVIRFSRSWTGKVFADIWKPEKPADALASIANFLRRKASWDPAMDRTMVEVRLDRRRFDFKDANKLKELRPAGEFARGGVMNTDRSRLIYRWRESGIYLPAGCQGPAFLINKNFQALLVYNLSYAYALKVSLLAESLRQAFDGETYRLTGEWPRRHEPLSKTEIRAMQMRLIRIGYRGAEDSTLETDGRLGSDTRFAVQRFQKHMGLCPDGIANRALFHRLMRATRNFRPTIRPKRRSGRRPGRRPARRRG